jgi:hypothetical protein
MLNVYLKSFVKNTGAHNRNRTDDLFLTKEVLYRLSYMGNIQTAQPKLERVMGIEPTSSAWKAEVLPLNYTRDGCMHSLTTPRTRLPLRFHYPQSPARLRLVEGGGFEPPKAEPSDLQSDPFGRSGTPPEKTKPQILRE